MILYIDVLFLENVIVNYGILQITEKLSGCYSSGIRKFISAIIGAVYLVIMLLCPAIRTMYTVAGKLLLSVLMIAVAFPFREMKSALKHCYPSTFLPSSLPGGICADEPDQSGIYFKNGEFYNQMKSDTLLLVLTLIFGFLMVRAFTDIFRRRVENESYIVKAYIHLGKEWHVSGFNRYPHS